MSEPIALDPRSLRFEKAGLSHKDLIFQWLAEPHMIEFWDNTQAHKDDILNFIHGRPQHYFYGTTCYWIGFVDDVPFSFILSDIMQPSQDMSELHRQHLSASGTTVVLDFGIGSPAHLGKGLAALTLTEFMQFYGHTIDPKADTFFIDPDEQNPRAQHVYAKAGFELRGSFDVLDGAFKGSLGLLMVKKV